MKFKITLFVLFLLIILSNCDNKENIEKTNWDMISSSKEWEEFAFFVQNYPQSKNLEKAIYKSISLFKLDFDCGKHNLTFNSFHSDYLLCNGNITSYDSIRFITNNYLKKDIHKENSYLIEFKSENLEIPFSKSMFEIEIPKNGISLNFKKALIEITKGVNDYKEHLAINYFNKSLKDLSSTKREYINNNVYNRLIFWEYTPK